MSEDVCESHVLNFSAVLVELLREPPNSQRDRDIRHNDTEQHIWYGAPHEQGHSLRDGQCRHAQRECSSNAPPRPIVPEYERGQQGRKP